MFDWNEPSARASDGPGSMGPRAASSPAVGLPDHLTPEPFHRLGERARGVEVVDETFRDGLQSVSGINPPIGHKVDLLHAMARVGVDVVSVGLPATSARNAEDTYLLCREIQSARLPLVPTAAARTMVSDVEGIARAAERAGMPIEVYSFIGSSPIRIAVEGWDLAFLVDKVRSATLAAVGAGLPFCLVTEDTTRSHPDVLRVLFRAAIEAGACRLCLCDTTGHVTPYGVEELTAFTRRELAALGTPHIELDWHGHNDRGLALPTALWAASLGIERVHGTGLGVGERVGNTSLELLVDNLGQLGARPAVPRARLLEYVDLAARMLSWTIPVDHPLAGERFRLQRAEDREAGRPSSASAPGRGPQRPPGPPSSRRAVGLLPTGSPNPDRLVPMTLRIEGQTVELAVRPRRTLLEALRYDLDLIGTKQGCDKGDCGACTVVLDGEAVLSCLTLALAADGCVVKTVEGLAGAPHLDPLLDCFDQVGGGQCGFCTPGMLMSATALLDRDPWPTRDAIKLAISGNLCRCTGYGRIVDAVEMAARIRRGEAPPGGDLPGTEHVPPPHASNARPAKRSEAER